MSDANKEPDPKSLKKELVELEARLLRQEHRPLAAGLACWTRKERYPDSDDPRRTGAVRGCLGVLLLLMAGGSFAITPSAVMVWQSLIMRESNSLMRESMQPKSYLTVSVMGPEYTSPQQIDIELGSDWVLDDSQTRDMAAIEGLISEPITLLFMCSGDLPFVVKSIGPATIHTATLGVDIMPVERVDRTTSKVMPNDILEIDIKLNPFEKFSGPRFGPQSDIQKRASKLSRSMPSYDYVEPAQPIPAEDTTHRKGPTGEVGGSAITQIEIEAQRADGKVFTGTCEIIANFDYKHKTIYGVIGLREESDDGSLTME